MSLRKRVKSKAIQVAAARAAGIQSIDALPSIDARITLAGYQTLIGLGVDRLAAYNRLLAEAGAAKNLVEQTEREIRDYSERILATVAAIYGRDSDQYEMAGGKRRSDRRRRAQPAVVVPFNQAA